MITDRLLDIKEKSHAMRLCEWYNSRLRNDVNLQRLHTTKAINVELQQQNKELLLLRRARMKEFLTDEAMECVPSPPAVWLRWRCPCR